MNQTNIWWVGWVEGTGKDPTKPFGFVGSFPEQARYFIQISAQTLFLVLSHTFRYFHTHLIGTSSKL